MIESQTETRPTQTEDTDAHCFTKARAKGEPTFTLRAQDVTADLVVDFWTLVQARVRTAMDAGATMGEAIEEARQHFGVPDYPGPIFANPKLDRAVEIKHDMRAWPNRKLAD